MSKLRKKIFPSIQKMWWHEYVWMKTCLPDVFWRPYHAHKPITRKNLFHFRRLVKKWRFLTHFLPSTKIFACLVNKWSLLFQKGTQVGIWNFFHFWFFVAFNSRDMTMLWVLNLYSRSSPTKLWKRIFDLRSQKNFFDTQSCHVGNFSRNGSMGNFKFTGGQ